MNLGICLLFFTHFFLITLDSPIASAVTRSFITNLEFTKYCDVNADKSMNNPNNVVIAYDLFCNYLDSNPPSFFNKTSYDNRIDRFNQDSSNDQELWLTRCKQYLVKNLSLMELNVMGIGGKMLDSWNKAIARLGNGIGSSYVFYFIFFFCFLFVFFVFSDQSVY